MSTRKTKDIRKSLLVKGFKETNTHHEMYWLYIGSRKTSVRTRISHSESEYGDKLLGQMAKQVGLSKAEFDDLIECPLSYDEYVQLLIARGIIKLDRSTPSG